MKPLSISLDLDDTVVSFYDYYVNKFGIPKDDKVITRKINGVLLKDKEFWLSQPIIHRPNFKVHNYCTARVINKELIKKQLEVNNLPKAPIYQVLGCGLSKYPQIKRCGCDVHIDDNIRVWKELNERGKPCLLMDSPINKHLGPYGRVYTLDIEEIEEVYYLFMKTIFPHFKEFYNDLF